MNDNLAHITRNQSIDILNYQPAELIGNSSSTNPDDYIVHFPNSFDAISHSINRPFLREQDLIPLAIERIAQPQLRIAHKSEKLDALKSINEPAENINSSIDQQAIIATSISQSIDQIEGQFVEGIEVLEIEDHTTNIVDSISTAIFILPENRASAIDAIDEDEERIEGDIKYMSLIGASCIGIYPEIESGSEDSKDKESAIIPEIDSSLDLTEDEDKVISHFFSNYRRQNFELYSRAIKKELTHYEYLSYGGTEKVFDMQESTFLKWLKDKNEHGVAIPTRVESDLIIEKTDETPTPTKEPQVKKSKRKSKKKKKAKKKAKKAFLKSLAEKSYELKDEIVSETLADLLAGHGHEEKAIEMYRKLSLLYPKKSSYFASRINELSEKK